MVRTTPLEGAEAVGAEGPGRQLTSDAAAAAQHAASDGEFVGRGADVLAGVVEHEILEMHELALEPQRGAGIGKILALEQAGADGRAGDALVETAQSGCRLRDWLEQAPDGSMSEIVTL